MNTFQIFYLDRCIPFFEAIDQKLKDLRQKSEAIDPSKTNTVEKLNQEDDDDEGEDLMDTDNKEDIESETEEDRAFIDRVLDREREEQSENDHECA